MRTDLIEGKIAATALSRSLSVLTGCFWSIATFVTGCYWPKAVTMYVVNLWAILRLAFIRRDAWEGKNGSQTQNAPPAECAL